MSRQVLEGTWAEVCRHAPQLAGRRVRVIVLPSAGQPADSAERSGTMIRLGMFPQLRELTDEAFAAAEFHGGPDDGLDWS